MYSRIVPCLYKNYRKLLKTSDLPLKRKVLSEESLNLETALSLIDECEKMIKEREKREISILLYVKKNLSNVTRLIKEYIECKCKCADTMKLLHLQSKARDCLHNRLQQLLKDVELVISMLQDTIDILVDSQEEPNEINMIDVKEKFVKLLKVLFTKQFEYIEFKPNFERLCLERRAVPCSIPILNSEFDMFWSWIEEEGNLFVHNIFGDNPCNSEGLELIGNSLKVKERHFSIEELQKPTLEIQLTEEEKQIDLLRKSIILPLLPSIEYFQYFYMPTTLLDLKKIQLNVQRCKNQLKR